MIISACLDDGCIKENIIMKMHGYNALTLALLSPLVSAQISAVSGLVYGTNGAVLRTSCFKPY
jgi:hypothetical protein